MLRRQALIICVGLAMGLLLSTVTVGALVYGVGLTGTSGLVGPLAGLVALGMPASVLVGLAVRSALLQRVRLSWLRGRSVGHDGAAEPDGRPRADAAQDRDARDLMDFEMAFARASVVQAAALEGFGLLGVVAALVTGQGLFLAAPALAIVGIGMAMPTERAFRSALDHLTRPPEPRELRWLEAQEARS